MADERDEIRARINIVQLVGRTVRLTRAGKDWKGLCPFHTDKNPSFTVSERHGTYRCWACGEHGDLFTWVMKTRNVDFAEALQILAEEAGVTLARRGQGLDKAQKHNLRSAMDEALRFFQDQLAKCPEAKDYLAGRELDEAAVAEWEIGFAPDVGDALASHLKRKGFQLAECRSLFLVDEDADGGYFDKFRGRLMFPIRDLNGEVVAFGGRLLGDGVPKYINSGDTPLYKKSRVLYGMHIAKAAMSDSRRAVLCEGYLDVIACHRAGVKDAVASLGTALSEDHAKLLGRWAEKVVILYDADSAGMKAADRAIDVLSQERIPCRVALMPAGDDPDTLLRKQGPGAVSRAVDSGVRPTEYRLSRILHAADLKEEESWEPIFAVLAQEQNELELDRHIVRLAGLYPGATSPLLAQNAMRRQVHRLRGRRGKSQQGARALVKVQPLAVHSAEGVLLGALLDPLLAKTAWPQVRTETLWLTDTGKLLGRALAEKFGLDGPSGPPAVWLHQLDEEESRATLMEIANDPRFSSLSPDMVRDAVSTLERKAAEASLDSVRQSKGAAAAIDRLKQIRPRYDKDSEA